MDLQSLATARPSTLRIVLFNDRGLRAGWRLSIFAAILCAILGLLALAARHFLPGAPSTRGGSSESQLLLPLSQGIIELVLFLVVLLVCWVMSRIERRKVGEYGLPLRKPALSNFLTGYILWGFLPLSLLLMVMRGLHVFYFGGLVLHGIQALYWALLWGFAYLMVGLLEEYLFRGYALYTLGDGMGFWPAAIILGVAFAGVHMGNRGETRIGIAGVFLFAIFASAILRRTGNLWLAVGAHAGWDWGQSFFYGVSDSGFQDPGHLFNPHIQGPDWLSGGSVGPEGSIVTLIFWAVMTAGVLVFYRTRREPALVVAPSAAGPQQRLGLETAADHAEERGFD